MQSMSNIRKLNNKRKVPEILNDVYVNISETHLKKETVKCN